MIKGTKQYICTHLNQKYCTSSHFFLPTKKIWKWKILCYIKDINLFIEVTESKRLSTAGTACVNHDILLPKLEFYRERGKINDLIKSYLKNWYQRILMESKDSYESIFSNWEKVKYGVALGSIIGPLLFLFVLTTYLKSLKLTLCRWYKLNYYKSHFCRF